MPIYEYECPNCKKRFEVLQKADEDTNHIRCPDCQANKPRRILSLFSSGSVKSAGSCSTGST